MAIIGDPNGPRSYKCSRCGSEALGPVVEGERPPNSCPSCGRTDWDTRPGQPTPRVAPAPIIYGNPAFPRPPRQSQEEANTTHTKDGRPKSGNGPYHPPKVDPTAGEITTEGKEAAPKKAYPRVTLKEPHPVTCNPDPTEEEENVDAN